MSPVAGDRCADCGPEAPHPAGELPRSIVYSSLAGAIFPVRPEPPAGVSDGGRCVPGSAYIRPIMVRPNSEHDTRLAPSISRAKS